MARLTDEEKAQLRAARRDGPRPPRPAPLPAAAFVAFATFASAFSPAAKPVRFVGNNWKL